MNNNPTVLEIKLSSLEHNLNFFRSHIQKSTMVLAVVKASGYGSDEVIVAKYLEELGIDYFAVAYADEGISLREAGIKTPILVLHPQMQNLGLLANHKLEPNLYSKKIFESFLNLAKEQQLIEYPIHIKFNTGLNRLGFKEDDLHFLIDHIKAEPAIHLKSVFSHLVASEDHDDKAFALDQIKRFESIAEKLESHLGFKPVLHMSNTSGILNYSEAHFDMVRLGLGLYGFTNEPELNSKLKNVLSLKTVISQIHQIDKGESVGYNHGFTAKNEMKTATLPIGHADGLFRSIGQGKVFVKIKGHKAPIIGNVCMDMVMVDVTHINCQEGDTAILFDSQDEVLNLAVAANTISYEILTALGDRIKRKAH